MPSAARSLHTSKFPHSMVFRGRNPASQHRSKVWSYIPYLAAAFVIPIGVLMGIAISGGSLITMTLLLGTLYPVLRALGCSKPTCATAILLHTVVLISPARAAYYNALSLMEMEESVPLWFVRIQLPVAAVMVAVMMLLFVITSKYFDKKEGLNKEENFNPQPEHLPEKF